MNAAGNQDFRSLKVLANFGSLVPWLPQALRHDFGEFSATSDQGPATGAPALDPSFVLAALHASESLVRALFDESPISVAVFVPDGRLIRVNRAFGALLGYEPAELTGCNIDELMHRDDVAASRKHRRQLAEGARTAFEAEVRFTPMNRPEIWTRMSGRLQRSPHGQPPQIVAHLVEIPAPKRVQEENLRELETIFLSSWGPDGNL